MGKPRSQIRDLRRFQKVPFDGKVLALVRWRAPWQEVDDPIRQLKHQLCPCVQIRALHRPAISLAHRYSAAGPV